MEAGGGVEGVAQYLLAGRGGHDHRPGVDAGPGPERIDVPGQGNLVAVGVDLVDDGQRRPYCPLGVVLVGAPGAEQGQDPIPIRLATVPPKASAPAVDAVHGTAHNQRVLLRLEQLGQGGGTPAASNKKSAVTNRIAWRDSPGSAGTGGVMAGLAGSAARTPAGGEGGQCRVVAQYGGFQVPQRQPGLEPGVRRPGSPAPAGRPAGRRPGGRRGTGR